ncbi:inducible metalloproteinase inhibitor protein-like [Helicoverpa zea]|uniref:inducible metalloproteinase inhibitor protein-like n=1 Tax=Helicoverpa zea TaxID=7113 RepID=UPI001F56AF3D|nr:inducible metalloproteinase inhibitor protein-like [Helicoverpa zea]
MFKSAFVILSCVVGTVITESIECSGRNEHYECGSACQTTCATLGQECPIANSRCNGCYCDEGYARNDDGECIPIDDCPQ